MISFPVLDTAASGARLADAWMSAIANNVANSRTVRPATQEPFRAQRIVAAPAGDGSGVRIVDVVRQGGKPDVTYEPENPMADADGYVKQPVVDMTEELTAMILAQRLYSVNLQVHQQARETYRSALAIGRS